MNRYVRKFIAYLQVEKNYSIHTTQNYQSDLEYFLNFIDKVPVVKVDYQLLRKYLAHLRTQHLKPRSLARKLSTLRSFFKYLFREGIIQDSPAALLMSPKLDKPLPKFLSEAEMVALIQAPGTKSLMGKRDRAILETLYSTGIRVSELVGLDIGDVDIIGNIAKVKGKGKKERLVPIGNKAVRAIKDYLDDRSERPEAL
ncbi:MAG: site-specific integrase, partial [Candidatus Omnitrophica bacterium]|nr:site-specific integrase [Candidatus Omnitrophota bacterium]